MRKNIWGAAFAVALAVAMMSSLACADYVDTLTTMPGLISYWDLNETSGTIASDFMTTDTTDGDNTGTYSGSAGSYILGDAGPRPTDGFFGFAEDNLAPSFNKTDGQLLMSAAGYAGKTDLTMVGWVRSDEYPTSETHIGGIEASSGARYAFAMHNYGFSGGTLSAGVKRSDASQVSCTQTGGVLQHDQWHLVALTYEGGTLAKLYVDGYQKQSASAATSLGLATVDGIIFGKDIGSTRALDGQLDEFAFFDRALSNIEVAELWSAATKTAPGTVATAPYRQTAQSISGLCNYWQLDEVSGTTATDSVAGNTGTYVNVSGDPVSLGQPGAGPSDGFVGLPADNKATQFVWNSGSNHLQSADGQVLGTPLTGTSFDINEPDGGVTELTMTMWFKNNYNGEGYVAGFANGSSTGRYVFSTYSPDDTSLKFYVKSANGNALASGILPVDLEGDYQWHHVAQVWDGAEKRLRVYVDGVERYNGTNAAMSAELALPDGFYLGRDVPGETRNLGGFIDEVGLYDRALSASEVYELYDAAFVMVPEPASLAILMIGSLCLLIRRRQRNG